MFDHVYVDNSPDLAAQREEFARYLAAFANEDGHGSALPAEATGGGRLR
jgi:hypothetical protein